ncbi:hypothetical protein CGCA056_v006134 [Colletotrichum aenigma]|uniref:uncharacterized protein n=1 Tax=Colletotrichum aenigma TaxID=1215731 RepID=UPI0018726DF3|nr:uncharacterized protein CGCA056_v006134 [Colletotrichum aenigma]KAF5521129.1 hypothetical protein CGCA056_v006134 [Colletotrichum aenigma]
MGQWLSPAIQRHMLHPPFAVHRLSKTEVVALLEVASEVQYDMSKARKGEKLQSLAGSINADIDGFGKNSAQGYFVRMSHCSPKDADAGTLRPVFTIKDALVKLVSSERTVQVLLNLYYEYQHADEIPDPQLFFFPYHADVDRLSEWRCFIDKTRVVAIIQSKFYQCNHPAITDDALRSLAMQSPDSVVGLIEINPWGAHAGSGSLLSHWLDDADILNRTGSESEPAVVIRLMEEGKSPVVSRDEAYRIGRERIIEDELRCLRKRGMEWILGDDAHAEFMELSLPAAYSRPTTRKDGLEMFRRKRAVDDRIGDGKRSAARDHPRLIKLKRASLQGQQE